MKRKQLGFVALTVSLILAGRLIGAAENKKSGNARQVYDTRDLVVPATQEASSQTTPQVYDIRDLVIPVPDFPLESSPQAAPFISSVVRTAGQEGSPPQPQVANSLFNNGAANPAGPNPRQEAIDSITKLIMDSIDPASWKDNGGSIGSLREIHGLLFVNQTRENQQKIGALLSQFAGERGVMVRVAADWLLMPPAELSKLIKPNREGALEEIDPAALRNLPEKTRHFHAEMLGFSGQTVHVVSGRVRSVATSATAVVGTGVAAYQPEIAGLGGGIALQVTPRVDLDQQSAVVTLYSTFNDPESSLGPMQMIATPATTQPVLGEGTANTFQPVNTVLQELRTTVKLPLGKPVLVGGMTLEPAAKNTDLGQLVLILKVTATK